MPAGGVAEVLALFEAWGTQNYDEDVSQLDHALQTAALARAAGADDALVAAALLHDVGHLLHLRAGAQGDGQTAVDLGHEATGARWLAPVFPPQVTGPIALHVAAKRYRCAVDPAYHDGLSEGSRRSLVRQGGPMSPEEAERFAAHPAHADAVALRGWDDGGKVEDLDVPDLDAYRPLLEQLAR
ncbi:MAG TPA: HD domain-containing protein [Acidimicrobiales bacterium]|jgi:phosphonate degradation associated HDIG domain protein|nr:HD domain-containing protein [Acidimicrobiales bacterium]